MDIREYFQKEQKGFYKIFEKTLTYQRRKQLYDAINDWHESELKLLGTSDVVGHFYPIEAIYELSNLEYSTSSIEISDDAFKKGFDEIQQLLNSYSKIGIHPRIGEKYIPMTEGFDTPVIVTDICYCSHKIMVECECL